MKEWKYKAQLNIKFLECYFKTTLLLSLLPNGPYFSCDALSFHWPIYVVERIIASVRTLKVLTLPQALIPTSKCRVHGYLRHYVPFSKHAIIRGEKPLLGLTQEHLPTFSLSLYVWLGKSQEVQLPPSNFGNKCCKGN